MPLSKSEKKKVKKLLHTLDTETVSCRTGIAVSEIISYLNERRKPAAAGGLPLNHTPLTLKTRLLIYLGLGLLIGLAYTNSLPNDFVSDDIRYLKENPALGSLQFITDTPLTVVKALLNFLTHAAFGLSPWAFRLVNILFHLASVVAVFELMLLFVPVTFAIMAAAITAVHPVFTESVTWIGGGGYAMYGAFFLWSFYFYVTSVNNRTRYRISLLLFSLMLLTSEKAIPLTGAYVIYELVCRKLLANRQRILPFLLLGGGWLFYMLFGLKYATTRVSALESQFAVSGFYNPLVQIPVAISSYLSHIIYPVNLSFFYSQLAFPLPEYLVRLAVTFGYIGILILAYFRLRAVFLFLSIAVIALLPSMTPFIVAWVVAERYAYLAYVMLIVTFVYLVHRILPVAGRKYLFLMILLLPVLITLTILRNLDWTNEDTLWTATYRTAPSDPRVHTNVGEMHLKRKDYRKAEEEFKIAISLGPDRPLAYYNLGLLYSETNEYEKAVEILKEGINKAIFHEEPYQLLATILYEQGQYEAAEKALQDLLQRVPGKAVTYLNLGKVYLKLGKNNEAREAFEKTLELDPDFESARTLLESLK